MSCPTEGYWGIPVSEGQTAYWEIPVDKRRRIEVVAPYRRSIGSAVGIEGRGGEDTGLYGLGLLGVAVWNLSTAVRRSLSSRPKSRPFGAVGLETRLRAQPLAREARREAPQPFGQVRRGAGEQAHVRLVRN